MLRCLAVAIGITLLGCPNPATRPGGGTGAATTGWSLTADAALLTLPPGPDTRAALSRLDERADQGNVGAGWARLHYLIDAFDDARFRDDAGSRGLLREVMGRPSADPLTGPTATDAVIAFLFVETDRLLASQRLDSNATAARALLEFDAKPPTRRDQVFQRMVELKTVARGGGPLAHNARLRLFGFCREAFVDATRVPRRQRMEVMSFCLYPLYDSDPAPYFAADLDARAPGPLWRDLAQDMTGLIKAVATSEGRLAATGAAMADAWLAFIEARRADFPTRHEPTALGVPTVPFAQPYDWTPLLPIGDAQGLASPDALAERVRSAVKFDEHNAVAISLFGQARASAIYMVAGVASKAGGRRIDLAVGYPQKLTAPEGDYWHGRTQDGAVVRLGVVPLSLATLPGATVGADAGTPRAMDWDPRRATLGLHLVVDADQWQLVSPTGTMPAIATDTGSADPAVQLRAQLGRIRAAYPDEDGLVVVIGTATTYAALVRALQAAQRDVDGRRLFTRFALATAAPALAKDWKKSPLAQRVDRRARATVTLVPDTLAPRASVIRACFMDRLEGNPRAVGTIRVEVRSGKAVVTDGPRDRVLRACALDSIGPTLVRDGVASATVTLSIEAAP